MQGLGGCAKYQEEKCFISAYDAETGKEAWRFYTIAQEGEPGGDTWGKLPNLFRAGGETWITGSYDPDLNLTYWGVAQSKPWMRASRQSGNGATLFANSTVALNADTGKLAWYYSHAPGESLDLDEVFERVLVDDGGQKLVFSAGKAGILWKHDRKTGKYLGHKEMVFQNVYDSFDPDTGEPHYRNDIVENQIGDWVQSCPTSEGGHNWHAMSYHPRTNQLIIPVAKAARKCRRKRSNWWRAEAARAAPIGGSSNAGIERQRRQAGGLRCENPEGDLEDRAAFSVHDRRALDRRRSGLRGRYGPNLPRHRRENRQGAVGDAPGNIGAGFPADLQHRRQAIHRGIERTGRRQPAHGPDRACAGGPLSVVRECAVRVCAA